MLKDVLKVLNPTRVLCEEIAPRIHYRSGFIELRGTIETCTLYRVPCIIDYCCPHCYTIYIDIRYPTVSTCSITSAFAADIRKHTHIEPVIEAVHQLRTNARSKKQISPPSPVSRVWMHRVPDASRAHRSPLFLTDNCPTIRPTLLLTLSSVNILMSSYRSPALQILPGNSILVLIPILFATALPAGEKQKLIINNWS